MVDIGLTQYLLLSAALLCGGIAVMCLKRNAVGVLLGVELALNGAALNMVAAGHYQGLPLDGQIAALFVLVIAAAEAAIALAIFLNFYRTHATIDVDGAASLKG